MNSSNGLGFKYHEVSPRNMWEVEPILYWRVKRDGKWSYERARFAIVDRNLIAIEFPTPAIDWRDESE